MYVHTWVHMYIRIYVHTNIPTYVPMHIRTFMYSSLQSKIIQNLNNFTTLSHNYSYFCLCVLGFRAVLILRGRSKYAIIFRFRADSYGCIDGFLETSYCAAINLIPHSHSNGLGLHVHRWFLLSPS
jgi:hypothetical protein